MGREKIQQPLAGTTGESGNDDTEISLKPSGYLPVMPSHIKERDELLCFLPEGTATPYDDTVHVLGDILNETSIANTIKALAHSLQASLVERARAAAGIEKDAGPLQSDLNRLINLLGELRRHNHRSWSRQLKETAKAWASSSISHYELR